MRTSAISSIEIRPHRASDNAPSTIFCFGDSRDGFAILPERLLWRTLLLSRSVATRMTVNRLLLLCCCWNDGDHRRGVVRLRELRHIHDIECTLFTRVVIRHRVIGIPPRLAISCKSRICWIAGMDIVARPSTRAFAREHR